MSGSGSLFPAYAGVILLLATLRIWLLTFPRIRGGDPKQLIGDLKYTIFSPHTRG